MGALLIWLDRAGFEQIAGIEQGSRGLNDMARYHGRIFRVSNVVDGDTLDIEAPEKDKDYTRLRLWGVDTPETKHPQLGVCYFGPQASEFAAQMVLDKDVTIYLIENDTRDKYDRLLAYVKLPDGRYLNEELISEGFGYADFRFRHDFYNKYKQLEASARREQKGLWKEVTVDKMPPWRQKYESKDLN